MITIELARYTDSRTKLVFSSSLSTGPSSKKGTRACCENILKFLKRIIKPRAEIFDFSLSRSVEGFLFLHRMNVGKSRSQLLRLFASSGSQFEGFDS